MASLYEIDRAILECVDLETGELIDPERLENLVMERERKIEGVALWVKNLESDALAYKAEKDAFDKREKAALAKVESLKNWLADALGGQKFSTSKCAISFRKSTRLEVLEPKNLPKALVVETISTKPDANAIKALLKNGMEVPGCRLVENLNTQIK